MGQVTDLLISAMLGVGALMLAFIPLERAFPRWSTQSILRPGWLTDLFFLCGQYLLWTSLVFAGLAWFQAQADAHMPFTFRAAIAAQPWWLQMIEVIVLSDFLVYWAHRMQHRYEWLWRFHAVHHSSTHLDWLAAHREHPIDTVYTLAVINAPAILLGFDLAPIAGFLAFRGLWAIVIHSNLNWRLGPLEVLIGSPRLHHWHHDQGRDAGNYANISPMMDVIFGTHRQETKDPCLGIAGEHPRSYVGYLLSPFRS